MVTIPETLTEDRLRAWVLATVIDKNPTFFQTLVNEPAKLETGLAQLESYVKTGRFAPPEPDRTVEMELAVTFDVARTIGTAPEPPVPLIPTVHTDAARRGVPPELLRGGRTTVFRG